MTKRYYIRQDAAVLFLILIAWLCRMAHVYECPYQLELGYLRSVIYMAIPACWSVSIGRRVIQPQLRIYLIAEAWLMVFWIGVRFIKYSFVEDPCLTHWLWYLFYVSQIMMPTVSLFVSEALCKPETHRTPKRLHYLYLPALLLLALVLTNDLHQMVFVFPADGPRYPTDGYGYGIGFYLIDGWIIGCAAVTFAAILRKSRIPGIKKRILIPMGILTVLIIYLVLYILYVPFIKKWLNDVTVMFCLFLMAVFESFFRLNLIQTNTHYRRLFQITPTPACIVDGDGRQLAASDAYSAIPGDAMHRAEVSPVILQDRMRVSSAPIRIGHVVW
ncbi:MAG: hypothetical protein HUJ80_06995, partial [Firmicutes bacterium]|nr:hypothetical protein [Bacillota bacterium]